MALNDTIVREYSYVIMFARSKYYNQQKPSKLPTMECIHKCLSFYDNPIEGRCVRLNVTPQEEEQWNKGCDIDINNEDLMKYDNANKSEENTYETSMDTL